ncbi:MAG: retropepsin-like aspartic protease [candidate division WOR-3 bacterium]|nr:retropepsin-like aspartic protease [candidate division WOR-3 bacterium]
MAIIEKRIRLIGSKGSREVRVLFDSGASYSVIQPGLAREIARLERLPTPKHFGTAEKGRRVTAEERVSLDFKLNGNTLSDEFMVVSGITESAIIGAATMQKWRMKLDFEHDRVIVDPRVAKLRLLGLCSASGAMRQGRALGTSAAQTDRQTDRIQL